MMDSKSLLTENRRNPSIATARVSSIVKEKFSLIWSINHFGEFLDRQYEFLSPEFMPNSTGTSKWKLGIFPEIAYPEGVQIALRLFNVSNDDKFYSVNYTISLFDKNGTDHVLQYREKVFRYYLDYDQCSVASNRTIKSKNILQSNDTLTICCDIDLLCCESPGDKTSESLKSNENNSVLVMNDDVSVTDEKLNKFENINNSSSLNDPSVINKTQTKFNNINNSLLAPNGLPFENCCKKVNEEVKVINGVSEINHNVFPTSNIKVDETYFSNESSHHHKGLKLSPDEYEKKSRGLSEKIECFFNKTRVKTTQESWDSKNFKGLDTLSKDLNFLFTTKYQYDVIIHTKDGQIPAHKAILAARSEYFRTLPQDDKVIKIVGVSNSTFNAILFYMYTGQSPQMTLNRGIDILRACSQFHLDHLKDIAQNAIKSQINISNATDIFQIATEMKMEKLKMCALKFIANNSEAVVKSAKWNEMTGTDPHGAGEILLTIASFQNNK